MVEIDAPYLSPVAGGSNESANGWNSYRASVPHSGYNLFSGYDESLGTEPTFRMPSWGQLEWGGGTAATDIYLYRDSAGTLKIESNLIVSGSITGGGGFGVWNDRTDDGVADSVGGGPYLAVTDGFVMAYGYGPSTITGFTDSNPTPTTAR